MNNPSGAVVGTAGDIDAGIFPAVWEIEGEFMIDDGDDREFIRNQLSEAFSEICGEPVSVTFTDEYPDPLDSDDYLMGY